MKMLFNKTLKELSDLLKTQSISAEEITIQTFERVHKLEDKLHSFISLFEDEAIKQAKEVDKRLNKNKVSAISGVPIAVKDNICYKDHLTTCGSKILKNYIPPYNATVAQKIIDNEAIIVGKTNMDEFAMGSSTEYSYYGPTRNPYDTSKVPGGSSGGSAVAVASGEACVALGSDTGGNYMWPSL